MPARDDSQYVEEIRIRALRMMGDRRLQAADVAKGTHYSTRSVRDFLSGAAEFQTFSIARAVAAAHPGLGSDLPCPCCGRRMT